MKLNLVSVDFNLEVETTLIYIWIQLSTAVPWLIPLWWEYYFQLDKELIAELQMQRKI